MKALKTSRATSAIQGPIGMRLCVCLILLSQFAGCAHGVTTEKQVVVPESLRSTYEQFRYAPAMRAGDMLYLSGVVATRKDGESSNTPAIERAFDEIDMILAEAGADWGDVVDVTSYLTNLDRDLGPMWAVKQDRVPAPYPAWTAIGVDRLFGGDNAIIEIKVTAYRPR